jgi:hypothetical protein
MLSPIANRGHIQNSGNNILQYHVRGVSIVPTRAYFSERAPQNDYFHQSHVSRLALAFQNCIGRKEVKRPDLSSKCNIIGGWILDLDLA